MTYYIVVNEWNYPTNSGRELIGDYDSIQQAEEACKKEYDSEYDNFLDNINGDIYNKACGRMVKNLEGECEGYILHANDENIFFRSIIIERKV